MDIDSIKKKLEEVAVADVVDALSKKIEHRTHIIDLVSPDSKKRLFGQAVTVGFMPVRKDLMDPHKHSLGPAIYRSLGNTDPAGKVLVMSSGNRPDLSLGGSTKLSRIANLGMAGVLCDGRLRDFDDLSGYDAAFYCTGEATRAGGNMIQPYVSGAPVTLQGTTVVPGDWIFADATGAVIIPEGALEEAVSGALGLLQMASKAREFIRTEDPQKVMSDGSMEA